MLSGSLYNLCNVPEIVKTVKLGRLSWVGHLTSAKETSPCGKLTFSKPEGTRRAWAGTCGGCQDPHSVVAPVNRTKLNGSLTGLCRKKNQIGETI
jgi:hypothetical protein